MRVDNSGRPADNRIERTSELQGVQLLQIDPPAVIDDDPANEHTLAGVPIVSDDIEVGIHRWLLADASEGSADTLNVPKHEAEPRWVVGHRQDVHILEELMLRIIPCYRDNGVTLVLPGQVLPPPFRTTES